MLYNISECILYLSELSLIEKSFISTSFNLTEVKFMDKLLRPETFSADPSALNISREWEHWKARFVKFIGSVRVLLYRPKETSNPCYKLKSGSHLIMKVF